MRFRAKALSFAVGLAAAVLMASTASAIVVPVELNLTPYGSGVNQLSITIQEHVLNTQDTQTTNLTGYLIADLDVAFGSTPDYAATVSRIGFPLSSPGHLVMSDTTFRMAMGFVPVTLTDVVASPITPPYPSADHGYSTVTSGSFAISGHEVQMNGGTIYAPPLSVLGQTFPGIDMNLGVTPQNSGPLSGPNGSLAVTKIGQTGNQATYSVELTLPVSFVNQPDPNATLSGNGTIHATGTFTQTVPEPSSVVLVGMAIFGLLTYVWSKRSR